MWPLAPESCYGRFGHPLKKWENNVLAQSVCGQDLDPVRNQLDHPNTLDALGARIARVRPYGPLAAPPVTVGPTARASPRPRRARRACWACLVRSYRPPTPLHRARRARPLSARGGSHAAPCGAHQGTPHRVCRARPPHRRARRVGPARPHRPWRPPRPLGISHRGRRGGAHPLPRRPTRVVSSYPQLPRRWLFTPLLCRAGAGFWAPLCGRCAPSYLPRSVSAVSTLHAKGHIFSFFRARAVPIAKR